MMGIYVRVSTIDQARYGYSIEEQINLLVDYCKQNKLGKYRIYSDKGLSGTSMKRTRLSRLLEDIKDKEITTVLVYRLDRISRSSQDTEYLMNFFYENSCDFISVNEYFRFNTATGNNQMRILAANNQLTSDLASERTKMGLLGAAKEGHIVELHYMDIDERIKNMRQLILRQSL